MITKFEIIGSGKAKFFVRKCQRAYETKNCFHCFFTWSKKAIYLWKYYCIFVSQHIIWVLFGDTKLLIFSDFTKLICCYFVINKQVILLAKVEFFINQKSRHKLQQDSVYEIVITFAISLYITQNQIAFNNRSIKHTG